MMISNINKHTCALLPHTHTRCVACQSESCHSGLDRWARQSGQFISAVLSIIEGVWEKALQNVGQVSHQEMH